MSNAIFLKSFQSLDILNEKEISKIIKQTLEGLAYLHERDIVHRNIKVGPLFTF